MLPSPRTATLAAFCAGALISAFPQDQASSLPLGGTSGGISLLTPARVGAALDGVLGSQDPAPSTLEQNAAGAGAGGMSPRVRSMLLSLLVPGLGQYVAGDRTWSYVFFGAEAAVWASYAGFQIQGGMREDRFHEYAQLWAGVDEPKGQSSAYYSDLGTFMTYEDYRVVAIRTGEGELYSEAQHWAWPSEERRIRYLDLRGASEDAFQRAEFMLAAALLNRALSVVHAARSVKDSRSAVTFRVGADVRGNLMPTLAWQTRF